MPILISDTRTEKIDELEKSAAAHGVPFIRLDATSIEIDVVVNPLGALTMLREIEGDGRGKKTDSCA